MFKAIIIFSLFIIIFYLYLAYKKCSPAEFFYNIPTYFQGQYVSATQRLLDKVNKIRSNTIFSDPIRVGFSYDSEINRDQYGDFYDTTTDRRHNPNFKFVTRFRGDNLNPAKYSLPDYAFTPL